MELKSFTRAAFFAFVFLLPAGAMAFSGFVTESHWITESGKTTLKVSLRRPAASFQGPLPTVLIFGGFQTGAASLELFDPPEPINLITFEYPLEAPRKISAWEGIKLLPKAKVAVHTTIDGIDRLIAWAGSREDVDKSKIVLVGASFGSPFVSVAASRNPGIRGLVLVHGFGNVPAAISHRLGKKWERSYGEAGRLGAAFVARLLWWYAAVPAPERSLEALNADQSVLVLTAEEDDILPVASIGSLRQALDKSKAGWEEQVLAGGHLRPGETALVQALLAQSIDWMRRVGILP